MTDCLLDRGPGKGYLPIPSGRRVWFAWPGRAHRWHKVVSLRVSPDTVSIETSCHRTLILPIDEELASVDWRPHDHRACRQCPDEG